VLGGCARQGEWCAFYNMDAGATNCGFATFQQCKAAVSGVGGVVWAQSAVRRPAVIPPMTTAILLASSRVSNFAADRRPGSFGGQIRLE
jgi:hypothetical protein